MLEEVEEHPLRSSATRARPARKGAWPGTALLRHSTNTVGSGAPGQARCVARPLGYRARMTTTPSEPSPDPEVVPSGDPSPISTPEPEPGEDPGVPPTEPEIQPPADPS